jgi:hypothetical protein
MRMALAVVAASLAGVAACGGGGDGGPTNPQNTSDSTLAATIDGTPFSASTLTILTSATHIALIGVNGAQSMGLGFDTKLGTQSSGTGGTATVSVVIGQGSWGAGPNLATSSGTVTVTTATSNHVAGTFSFTAVSIGAVSTPATRQVTNGRFDVKF